MLRSFIRCPPVLLAIFVTSCGTSPHARVGIPPHLRPEAASTPGVIEVQVRGIPRVEGQLFVELYDEGSYFHYDRVLNERIVPVTTTSMTVQLEHVPAGRYMAVISHDANSNHRLDTNFFGAPTEAYGFSRGARGTFGPPAFDEGAFDFDGARAAVAIDIR